MATDTRYDALSGAAAPAADTARRFSVAPMLDWTTRDYRAFARCLTRHALLYSEMVTTGAILHGTPRGRFLDYSDAEHPIALQLGGSDPVELAECAAIGQQWGYDEINLNVGCPSDRVQNNMIGACLMAHPDKVARAVEAMQRAVDVPVTVKCRIGIDDQDSEAHLTQFIDTVAGAGCRTFIVHARKAWLQGLSPKENRDIPPLDYDRVHRLKAAHPDLHIGINGGITSLEACQQQLQHVDNVMVGREAYHSPYLLADVDRLIFGATTPVPSRLEAMQAYRPYVEQRLAEGVRLHTLCKPMLGLFHGQRSGRAFRRLLSERTTVKGAGIEVFDEALQMMQAAAMPRPSVDTE
ncbi:tRNA dihydrouridine(20/20a) synthase DusA [Zymobacter sp. IVIA_5232.4 C2]|uniref:tRNA dihydrouridine(20/20a) synthase DusA n=1 Tax=Zymobacter sp. IVIA_5232.4 C2 TaxID=3394855 RepID=UPI0039C29568